MLSSGAKAGVFATLGWTPGHSVLTLATGSLPSSHLTGYISDNET